MTSLVYGFVRAASDGWSDPVTLAAFTAGVVLLAVFVLIERRAEPSRSRRCACSGAATRVGAYVARVLVVGGMFGMFFFVTQYLQGVRELQRRSQAGLAFLPMTVAMFAMVRAVPRIRRAHRRRRCC